MVIRVQVREAADIPDVCVNLGHTYLLQKQYDHAIKWVRNLFLLLFFLEQKYRMR